MRDKVRNMKRKFTWIILLLLITALIIPVSAATEVTLTSTADAAERGDEITVTVSISALDACKKGGVDIIYDSDVFELVSGSWLMTNSFIKDFDANTKDGVFAYTDAAPISGEILRFTLKVKDDAEIGSTNVKVLLSLDGVAAEKSAAFAVVCNHSYGDWTEADANNHKHICSLCGDSETAKHNWDQGTTAKTPSCTAEGEKVYTCTDCGATKSETVEKTDHTWDAGEVTTAATCTSTGEKVYTCSICGETKVETLDKLAHTYNNACDTTCNDCGEVREIEHSYSTKWSSDGTNHWHQCTVCGDKTDEQAHIPGDAATEWEAQKCKVCDYVLKAALGHTHNFAQNWTTDEMGHWHECAGCDELKDYADHIYDNACDTDCNVCGYTREVIHTFETEWQCDDTGHWHECSACGAKDEVVAHTPGADATEDTPQVCTECGYVITPALRHTHTFEGAWIGDSTGHWQACDCGEKSQVSAHSWNQGTVSRAPTSTVAGLKIYTCTVCGEEKRETIPCLTGDTAESGFQMYVVFIVIGVVLVAAALFVAVGVIISKNKSGKFST